MNRFIFVFLLLLLVGCGSLESFRVELMDPESGQSVRGLAADGVSRVRVRLLANEGGRVRDVEASVIGGWGSVENFVDSAGVWSFDLVSSDTLPSGLESDSVVFVGVAVSVEGRCGGRVEDVVSVAVVREPVVFVHGLSSSDRTFEAMSGYFASSGLYCSAGLYRADYSLTSRDAFSVNAGVVPGGVDSVRRAMLGAGYVCSRAALVGHSMGGLLSREYLQGEGYRGDVSRLLTICTPHFGSSWADLSGAVGLGYLGDFYDVGAVMDLRSDSPRILALNSPEARRAVVPVHVVATTVLEHKGALPSLVGGALSSVASWLGADEATSNSISGVVGGVLSQSDTVVSLESQLGGIAEPCATIFSFDSHTTVHKSQRCMECVLELLYDPVGCSDSWSLTGFAPSVAM